LRAYGSPPYNKTMSNYSPSVAAGIYFKLAFSTTFFEAVKRASDID
jgi:hypothetical protein